MFKTAKRRRHDQIMEAARYMVDGLALFASPDDGLQLTPKSVVTATLVRHGIQATAAEAREALGAALTERGFDLSRMTTTFDR